MRTIVLALAGCSVDCTVESHADAPIVSQPSRAEAALELGELAYHEAARARVLGLAGIALSLRGSQCFPPSELKLLGAWGAKCGGSCTLDLGDKTYNPFAAQPVVTKPGKATTGMLTGGKAKP